MTAPAMTAPEPRYPSVVVPLATDVNPFTIIARVQRALRGAGVSEEERKTFLREAMAGDYDNVLRAAMRWVVVT